VSALLAFLAAHGGQLLAGSSAVLAAGALALAVTRAPIHRQRLAELAVAAALCCVVLAALPLPRFLRSAPAERGAVAPPAEPIELAAPAPAPPIDALPQAALAASPRVALAPPLTSLLAAPSTGTSASASTGTSTSTGEGASASATTSASAWTWPERLALVYLAGFLGASAYLLLGVALLRGLLRRAQPAPAWLDDLARRLADGVLKRAPRLVVTAQRCRPFCTGVRRPTIVLPADLCARRLAAPLRDVLLHEIAHLRQRDSRGHALFAAALPLLWFHPIYWWLRTRAHLAAELVADDLAARQSDGPSYVRSLIEFCERSSGRPLLGAVSILRSSSEFYRRMNMLLERESRLSTECSPLRRGVQGILAGALVALAAGVWGVPRLAAQEREPGTLGQVRAERDELSQEVQSLRQELKRLRKTLEARERAAEEPEAPMEPARTSVNQRPGAPAMSVTTPPHAPSRAVGVAGVRSAPVPAQPPVGTMNVGGVAVAPSPAPPVPQGGPAPEPPSVDRVHVAPPAAAPVAAPIAARSAAPSAERSAAPSGERSAAPIAAPSARSERGGRDLDDVIDLVTRAIDLEGELELCESRLVRATQQREVGGISEPELREAQVQHRTTERKLQAVRAVIAAERAATEMELQDAMENARGGEAESRRVRLVARLEVLRSVE
jgi:beta-lactamase regulating signal transducer with metallopeptidase domain